MFCKKAYTDDRLYSQQEGHIHVIISHRGGGGDWGGGCAGEGAGVVGLGASMGLLSCVVLTLLLQVTFKHSHIPPLPPQETFTQHTRTHTRTTDGPVPRHDGGQVPQLVAEAALPQVGPPAPAGAVRGDRGAYICIRASVCACGHDAIWVCACVAL